MDNNSIILSIFILSTILYMFVLTSSNKEEFRSNRNRKNLKCASKRPALTYLYAKMLEKRGAVLGENGKQCNIDIDCESRYCNNGTCSALCS